jgi:hypothetical protein
MLLSCLCCMLRKQLFDELQSVYTYTNIGESHIYVDSSLMFHESVLSAPSARLSFAVEVHTVTCHVI